MAPGERNVGRSSFRVGAVCLRGSSPKRGISWARASAFGSVFFSWAACRPGVSVATRPSATTGGRGKGTPGRFRTTDTWMAPPPGPPQGSPRKCWWKLARRNTSTRAWPPAETSSGLVRLSFEFRVATAICLSGAPLLAQRLGHHADVLDAGAADGVHHGGESAEGHRLVAADEDRELARGPLGPQFFYQR